MRRRPDPGNFFGGIADGAAFCQNQVPATGALMTLVLPARKYELRAQSRVHCYCSAGSPPVKRGVNRGDS
jgi:hypothetical protein